MAKKKSWSAEKYKIAIRGNDGLPGLRSIVQGFSAADGYNLHNIESWSSSQKRRVRDYYNRVHTLEAQPKIIVRPRSKQKLKELQAAFHGDIPSKKFKVAFIPYSDPNQIPGTKKRRPKIKYTKKGIIIDAGTYRNRYEPFDKIALVTNADAEIKRVIGEMPEADVFFVRTGEFQTLNSRNAGGMITQVKNMMARYDGVRELPASYRNRGDSPEQHHWSKWLNGIIGYEHSPDIDRVAMAKIVVDNIKAHKKARAANDKKIAKINKKRK